MTGIFNLSVIIIDTLQSFLTTLCSLHIKFLFLLLLFITHQIYLYYSACLSIMISYSVLQFFYLLSLKCKFQERKIWVTHFIFLPTPLDSRSCILEWSQTLYAARMTLNIWSSSLRPQNFRIVHHAEFVLCEGSSQGLHAYLTSTLPAELRPWSHFVISEKNSILFYEGPAQPGHWYLWDRVSGIVG